MKRSKLLLPALAVLAVGAASYCFVCYAMTASLTVPATSARDARTAVLWGIGFLVSTAVGIGFAVAVWWGGRRGPR